MRMKSSPGWKALVLAGASALLLAIPAAAGHGGGHGPGPGPGHGPDGVGHIRYMAAMLGLSDEQTTRVEAIAATYMDGALGEAMKAEHEAREALAKTIHDLDATDEAVTQAASVVGAVELRLAVQRHRMVVEMSSVLTAEQRAKLDQVVEDVHSGRHGPDGGHPPGH